ncbi:hypothetical protein PWT90_10137 [Aphanocladium album]|nr:hypothetical protein PWT90_10137 [Aphanocladium album]
MYGAPGGHSSSADAIGERSHIGHLSQPLTHTNAAFCNLQINVHNIQIQITVGILHFAALYLGWEVTEVGRAARAWRRAPAPCTSAASWQATHWKRRCPAWSRPPSESPLYPRALRYQQIAAAQVKHNL